MRRLIFFVLVLVSPFSWAGNVAGIFSVQVNLAYREKCASETLSQQTNALVQVVCATGQFVSIEPSPGKPFVGTHGGAFRYFFQPGSSAEVGAVLVGGNGQVDSYSGYGTVTGMRVYNLSGSDGPAELLVTF